MLVIWEAWPAMPQPEDPETVPALHCTLPLPTIDSYHCAQVQGMDFM